MERKICAAAVQFHVTFGDVESNLQRALAGIRRVRQHDARLAVLPEMWSTGYDYRHLAALSGKTPRVLEALREITAELDMVVVGSLPTQQEGKIYNTAYVVDRGKVLGSYAKLHLFSTMGEDRFLAAGESTLVVDTLVGRLGVAICYDLRFPEHLRKLALEGAEILCIPAEWPRPREDHWRTLLRARAIENQLFVIAANCCGVQGKLDFFGMSMLIAPRGEVLAETGDQDAEITALFDFAQMENYRAQIPCFKDRRPEIYGTLP